MNTKVGLAIAIEIEFAQGNTAGHRFLVKSLSSRSPHAIQRHTTWRGSPQFTAMSLILLEVFITRSYPAFREDVRAAGITFSSYKRLTFAAIGSKSSAVAGLWAGRARAG